MGLGSWAREHLLATIAIALTVGSAVAVSILGVLAWVLALFVAGPQPTLSTLMPVFLAGIVLGTPVAVLSVVGVGYGLAARVSAAAGNARFGRVFVWADRYEGLLRRVGLSGLVDAVDTRSTEQRATDRIERLKSRYVKGDLSEPGFERRVCEVLDEEGVGPERVSALDGRLEAALRADDPGTEIGEHRERA